MSRPQSSYYCKILSLPSQPYHSVALCLAFPVINQINIITVVFKDCVCNTEIQQQAPIQGEGQEILKSWSSTDPAGEESFLTGG